jgi:membrane protein DedA with SNARE-associated domain
MNNILNIVNNLTDPNILAEYSRYLLLIILVFSFLEVAIPPIPGDTMLVVECKLEAVTKNEIQSIRHYQ